MASRTRTEMAARRLARVMQHQFQAARKADHPNLIPHMDEADIKVWHFLVTNLPAPYAGGEYIFRLKAPSQFPQKPPEFQFMTKNGVFVPGGKICISIGEFHAGDRAGKLGSYGWRPALGMGGFAREVVNGMIDPEYLGGGVRVCNASAAKKAKLAAASAAFNAATHSGLMARFREFEEAHPDHRAVRLRRMWRAARAALDADLRAEPLDRLPPLISEAFGAELWSILADSLAGVGAAAFGRVVDRLREALAERELPIRRALVYALRARFCLEAGGRSASFQEAYAALLSELPGVCGGACRVAVPAAMHRAGAALPALHAKLAAFLRTQDIDVKARRGLAFASAAEDAARCCSSRALPEPPAAPDGEPLAAPEGASPAAPGDEPPAAPDGEPPAAPDGEPPAAPEGEPPAAPEGEPPAAPESSLDSYIDGLLAE